MDKETMKIKWRKLCFEGVKLIIKNKIEKWKSGGGNKKGDKQIFEQIVDTVSFFEIPHEYQFLVMEHYLKNCDEKSIEDSNNKIRVGDNCYDKIIICPLVIDFGYKNIPKQVHYSITPNHPVDNQIGDMFYAIRTYCRFKLELNKEKNKFKLSDEILEWYDRRDERTFEIYPFLGLDTQHYNDVEEIKNLLDKYFRDFKKEDTAEHRRGCLFNKMGMLDSNLYRDRHTFTGEDADRLKKAHLASDYQHAFAGIKVYPQLGFDPYPEDSLPLEKVKLLTNDILLFIDPLKELFIPVNKVGSQGKENVEKLNRFYDSDDNLITFPSGKCSRKIKGIIIDPEWKKNFIVKAVQHKRDIVPIYFDGYNSKFFYRLANFRTKIGIKANIEMLYLADELFKNRGSHFTVKIGNPIPWQTFDKSKSQSQWAAEVKSIAYSMK